MLAVGLVTHAVRRRKSIVGPVLRVRLAAVVVSPILILARWVDFLRDALADQSTHHGTDTGTHHRADGTGERADRCTGGRAARGGAETYSDGMRARDRIQIARFFLLVLLIEVFSLFNVGRGVYSPTD